MGIRGSKSGVSLFEVLAAIIIFGVGILTVLSMITNNINWVHTIRLKDTATMLAKEGIEVVYNMRDSNLEKGIDWFCANFDTGAADNCGYDLYDGGTSMFGGDGTDYRVAFDLDGIYTLEPLASEDDAYLYYHTGTVVSSGSDQGFRYSHESTSGTLSQYRRYLIVRPVAAYPNNTGNILQIEGHVIVTRGVKEIEIILESMIGDII